MSQRFRHQPDRRVFGDLQRRTFFDNLQASGEAQVQQQQVLPNRGSTPKMSLSQRGPVGTFGVGPAPTGYFPPVQQNPLPVSQAYNYFDPNQAGRVAQQHQHQAQYQAHTTQYQQQQQQHVHDNRQWDQSHVQPTWPSMQQQPQQQRSANHAQSDFYQHPPPQSWNVQYPGGGEQPHRNWPQYPDNSAYFPQQYEHQYQAAPPQNSYGFPTGASPNGQQETHNFSSRAHLATVGRSLLGEPKHNHSLHSVHSANSTQTHQPLRNVKVRTFAPNSAPHAPMDSFSTTTARIGFGGNVESLSKPSAPARRRGHPRTQARPEAQWYQDTLRQAELELQEKQGVIAAGAGRLRKEQELRSQRVNARDAFKLRPAVHGEKMAATVAYSNAVGNSFFKPL
eukprot:INCI11659.1.p1 GENE.INCI11659.1~~INCI11659.1.p1  ORF type:complete len:394 (+),score=46.04 INCI11659.1:166-1347(+)